MEGEPEGLAMATILRCWQAWGKLGKQVEGVGRENEGRR